MLYSKTGFDGHGPRWHYKMYYDSGQSGTPVNSIWVAYSNDMKTWYSPLMTPVIAGQRHPHVSYDVNHFGNDAGDLIQASFTETYSVTPYYKAWLWYNDNFLAPTVDDVRFAYSADGETWYTNYQHDLVPHQEPTWENNGAPVYDLEVIYLAGGYLGWADNNGQMYNVTSSDGTTWTPVVSHPKALPVGGAGTWDSGSLSRVSVIRLSDTEWQMWYGGNTGGSGLGGVGYATSSDGLTWSKDPDNPIQSLGGFGAFGGFGPPGSWNTDRNYAPCVVYDVNRFSGYGDSATYKMMRSGVSAAGNYTLGLANVDITRTATALSASVSSETVLANTPITIWGRLTSGDNSLGSATTTVTLEIIDDFSGFPVTTVATYDPGTDTYWALWPVTADVTNFRFSFAGDATYGPTTSDWKLVTLTGPPNSAPTAVDDPYAAKVDTTLTVPAPGVLADDTDPEDDTLVSSIVATAGHGSAALASDGSFTYRPDNGYEGQDTFTYHAYDGALSSNVATVTLTITDDPTMTRVNGVDRYEVAAALGRLPDPTFSDTTQVVIASGLDAAAADPLSASGITGIYDAPLLLVRGDRPTSIPNATRHVLDSIASGNGGRAVMVHIVGGPKSVPESLRNVIKSYLPSGSGTERISGVDRFQVAANVANRMRTVLGPSYPTTAFITNGTAPVYFWSALAASPVTARRHFPILPVKQTSIPGYIDGVLPNYTTRIIVGGSEVGGSVQSALGGSGKTVERIGGSTRYQIAVNFANRALTDGWLTVSHVAIASQLPDSLTGGSAFGTAAMGGPLLYTSTSSLDSGTSAFLATHKSQIDACYVLGGTKSVPTKVWNQIAAALGIAP